MATPRHCGSLTSLAAVPLPHCSSQKLFLLSSLKQRNNHTHQYRLGGDLLKRSPAEKDLGVLVASTKAGQESQWHPGVHQEKSDQQGKGGPCSFVLCPLFFMTTKADEKKENQIPTSCGTQAIRTDVIAPGTAGNRLLQTASALNIRNKLGPAPWVCAARGCKAASWSTQRCCQQPGSLPGPFILEKRRKVLHLI